MIVTVIFLGLVGLSALIALSDWRRGWMLAVVCGVLQDPVRKLTPGQPVVLTFAIAIVFAAIIFATRDDLQRHGNEFARRFPSVAAAVTLFVCFLILAAANGLINFGLDSWKAPAMSLALYLAPIPTVLVAYFYLDREERLYAFIRLYAGLTAVALLGTFFEYYRLNVPGLGLVASGGADYIRHLPGIQIRMVSGFYRGPDTMGLHAATLAAIGIAMGARSGFSMRAWPWFLATGWGFTAAMVSGRRKALYFIAVFVAIFVWRYVRRMRGSQAVAIVAAALLVGGVVNYLRARSETNVYAQGALASHIELASRIEGGALGTIQQVGFMGAGLGVATQGVRHFISGGEKLGWQEGGLAKLTAELGVPGVLAAFYLALMLFSVFLRLSRIGDVPGSSQFARVMLFGLVAANAASFIASAQAYSDPLLMLLAAFFLGALFATATLDERLTERQGTAPISATVPVTA